MRVISGVWALVWFASLGCSAQRGSEADAARARAAESPALALGPELGTEAPVLIQKDVGWNPSVASDGAGFLAAETIADRVRAVRVDANGNVLDPYWLSLGGEYQQTYPDIAFGAGRYLVTWTEPDRAANESDPDDDVPTSVRGRFVEPDGSVEGSSSFVVSSGDAFYSSAAWLGSHFIVAWIGFESASANVHTALLDDKGARVPGSEHVVSTSGHASDPELAVSADQAFVTWHDYSASDTGSTSVIYGARVAADGSVLDPGGQPLSSGDGDASWLDVASDGASFFSVWQTSGSPAAVRGSLVSADGDVVVRDKAISDATIGSGLPSVAFDGTGYVVAWASDREDRSVYGVRVATSGEIRGSETRLSAGSTRSGAFGSDRTVLAFNGEKLLLAYMGVGVQGTLLSPELDIELDAIGLTALPNAQGYPQATWDGVNYLVSTVNELSDVSSMTLRGVRIDAQGTVLDPSGLALSSDSPAFGSALASTQQGSALVSWMSPDEAHSQALRSVSSTGALGEAQPFPQTETYSGLALAANGSTYLAVLEDVAAGKISGYFVDPAGNVGDKLDIADAKEGSGAQVFAAGDGFLVSYRGTDSDATQLVSVSVAGVVGTPVTVSEGQVFVRVATNGQHSLLTWSANDAPTIYGQRVEDGALVGERFVISEQSSGFGAAVVWDGSSYFSAWDLEDYTIHGRFIAADGTLGEVIPLVSAEASGPVLSSDGEGQMLLSYLRWFEHAQSRRVRSRLLGRDATGAGGETGEAGAGGVASGGAAEGGGNAGQNSTVSGGGGSAQSSGAGGVASAGAPSGGGASSGGSRSGGNGGVGAAAAAGAGGATEPSASACSVQPARGPAAATPLWLVLALTALVRARRKQLS